MDPTKFPQWGSIDLENNDSESPQEVEMETFAEGKSSGNTTIPSVAQVRIPIPAVDEEPPPTAATSTAEEKIVHESGVGTSIQISHRLVVVAETDKKGTTNPQITCPIYLIR